MIEWFQSISSSARRNGGGPMRRRHRAVPWHGIRIRHNIAQACQAQRRASEYLRTVGKPTNASEHQRRYADRRDASKVLSHRLKRRPDKMRRFRRSRIRSSQALPSGTTPASRNLVRSARAIGGFCAASVSMISRIRFRGSQFRPCSSARISLVLSSPTRLGRRPAGAEGSCRLRLRPHQRRNCLAAATSRVLRDRPRAA
jgi:hypothetical protein